MDTKTATSSSQCFKGTIVFFIEDPKSTFVCAVNLFVCFVSETRSIKSRNMISDIPLKLQNALLLSESTPINQQSDSSMCQWPSPGVFNNDQGISSKQPSTKSWKILFE